MKELYFLGEGGRANEVEYPCAGIDSSLCRTEPCAAVGE